MGGQEVLATRSATWCRGRTSCDDIGYQIGSKELATRARQKRTSPVRKNGFQKKRPGVSTYLHRSVRVHIHRVILGPWRRHLEDSASLLVARRCVVLLIYERLGDLQGLNLRHSLAISLGASSADRRPLATVLSGARQPSAPHRRDLGLQHRVIVHHAIDLGCFGLAARKDVTAGDDFLRHSVGFHFQ